MPLRHRPSADPRFVRVMFASSPPRCAAYLRERHPRVLMGVPSAVRRVAVPSSRLRLRGRRRARSMHRERDSRAPRDLHPSAGAYRPCRRRRHDRLGSPPGGRPGGSRPVCRHASPESGADGGARRSDPSERADGEAATRSERHGAAAGLPRAPRGGRHGRRGLARPPRGDGGDPAAVRGVGAGRSARRRASWRRSVRRVGDEAPAGAGAAVLDVARRRRAAARELRLPGLPPELPRPVQARADGAPRPRREEASGPRAHVAPRALRRGAASLVGPGAPAARPRRLAGAGAGVGRRRDEAGPGGAGREGTAPPARRGVEAPRRDRVGRASRRTRRRGSPAERGDAPRGGARPPRAHAAARRRPRVAAPAALPVPARGRRAVPRRGTAPPRRRHGPREDRAGDRRVSRPLDDRPRAARAPHRPREAEAPVGPRVGALHRCAGRGRRGPDRGARRPLPRHARGLPDRELRAGAARPRGDARVGARPGRARRGAAHQELGDEDSCVREAPAPRLAARPDRHADGEPSRRAGVPHGLGGRPRARAALARRAVAHGVVRRTRRRRRREEPRHASRAARAVHVPPRAVRGARPAPAAHRHGGPRRADAGAARGARRPRAADPPVDGRVAAPAADPGRVPEADDAPHHAADRLERHRAAPLPGGVAGGLRAALPRRSALRDDGSAEAPRTAGDHLAGRDRPGAAGRHLQPVAADAPPRGVGGVGPARDRGAPRRLLHRRREPAAPHAEHRGLPRRPGGARPLPDRRGRSRAQPPARGVVPVADRADRRAGGGSGPRRAAAGGVRCGPRGRGAGGRRRRRRAGGPGCGRGRRRRRRPRGGGRRGARDRLPRGGCRRILRPGRGRGAGGVARSAGPARARSRSGRARGCRRSRSRASGGVVRHLFAGIAVRTTADGGLRIDARPESAATLAAMLEGLAGMLRASAAAPAAEESAGSPR